MFGFPALIGPAAEGVQGGWPVSSEMWGHGLIYNIRRNIENIDIYYNTWVDCLRSRVLSTCRVLSAHPLYAPPVRLPPIHLIPEPTPPSALIGPATAPSAVALGRTVPSVPNRRAALSCWSQILQWNWLLSELLPLPIACPYYRDYWNSV